MPSQRDSRLPVPYIVKQPYAPIFARRPQALLMPGNAAGNRANALTSQKIYPCRHCDRTFTTAEGMAGHTNVHARTMGALGKRKAETELREQRPYLIIQKAYTISPQPHPAPYATSRPVNYGPVALVPYGTISATRPFYGQLPNQFRGASSSSFNSGLQSKLFAPAATFAPPRPLTTTIKALKVRDFLGPFAAKATPSALVVVDEEDGSGLDLELKL